MFVDEAGQNVFPGCVDFGIAGSGPLCHTASYRDRIEKHHLSDVISFDDDVGWTGRWRSVSIDDGSVTYYESSRALAVNWRSGALRTAH